MVGTTTYYLHQDALGSTRLVTTSTVTIKFSSNYVPYGANYGVTGKEVFMYTGKPSDSATGLYYYGARYYDPTTGRFVTEDSDPGSMEDPMSLNRYVYARDNPMRLVDLNGNNYIPPQVTQSQSQGTNWLGTTVSNWWNSMPPNEQQAVVVTGLVVAAAAVTVLTAGAAAPTIALALSAGATSTVGSAAIGASASAVVYTVTAGSKATPTGVALNAAVGTLGGGLSGAVTKTLLPIAKFGIGNWMAGQALSGLASNFANQAVVSAQGRRPGNALVVTGEGLALGVLGGAFDRGSQSFLGSGARSAFISGGATALAQNYADNGLRLSSPNRIE